MAIKYWVGTSAANRNATWNPAQVATLSGPWSLTPGGTVRTTNPLVGDVCVFPQYAPAVFNYVVTNNAAQAASIPMGGFECYGSNTIQFSKTCTFSVFGNVVGGTGPQVPYMSPSRNLWSFNAYGSGPTAPAGDRYFNWGSSTGWGGGTSGNSGGENLFQFNGNLNTCYFQSALTANFAYMVLRSGTLDTGGYSTQVSLFTAPYIAANPDKRLVFRGGTINLLGNGTTGATIGYLNVAQAAPFTSDSSSYGDTGGFVAVANTFLAVSFGNLTVTDAANSIPFTWLNNPAGTTFPPNVSNNSIFSNFSFGGSYGNQINRATTLTVRSFNTPTGSSIANISLTIGSPGGRINTGTLSVGNVTVNAPGGTTTLGNTLTVINNFSMVDGNIDLNGFSLNVPTFVSDTAVTRGIVSSTGQGNINPSTGNFFTNQGTFTTSSNVTIRMPGGGTGVTLTDTSNVGNILLNSGSVLNIITGAGANVTIKDILTNVRPSNINMSTTGTFNLSNLSLAGNAGNAVTFQSNSAGTQFRISKPSGTITASYLNIKDSNASGGASWLANNGTNSDGGNNTGWVFVATVSGINGQFFVFF